MRDLPAVSSFLVAWWLASMPSAAAERKAGPIPICVEGDLNSSNQFTIGQGELIATKLFERIGIGIEWHNYPNACPEEHEPILVRVRAHTPGNYQPGASGTSWPYEGVHVEIFYDRMQSSVESSRLTALVGHVLAHEIAHALGGTEGHSSGVMQARFSWEDIEKMSMVPLRFPAGYAILLRAGVRTRHERLVEIRGKGLVDSRPAEAAIVSKPR